MLAEAVQKYGLSPQGLVRRLTQTAGLLAGLSHHRMVPSTVVAMNVHIEPLTIAILQQAADLSVTHALLTNDAALLAHMQARGMTHLDAAGHRGAPGAGRPPGTHRQRPWGVARFA